MIPQEIFVEYYNLETDTRAVTVAQDIKQIDSHTFHVTHEYANVDWWIDLELGDEILIQRVK